MRRTISLILLFLILFSVASSLPSGRGSMVVVTKGANYNLTDYGNGTYKWVSAPQRIWDVSNNSWVGWKLEDLRSTLGFIQIKNSRIGVRIYPYYAEFWNPNMTEVRVSMEQWQVEALNPTNQKWTSVAMPSPSFQPEATSIIQNTTGVYVYQIYPQNYAGRLTVTYILKAGEPLKHEISYVSLLSTREHRVNQIWSGIISAFVRTETSSLSSITTLTTFSDFIYEWVKADGSLVVRENQRNAKNFFDSTSVNVDAGGSKASFIFSNSSSLTIGNGGRFIIDPTTDTFASASYGYLVKRGTGVDYPTAKTDAVNGGVDSTATAQNPYFGQNAYGTDTYEILRGYSIFNTATIPDASVVTGATYYTYYNTNVSNTASFNVAVYSGNLGATLDSTDWGVADTSEGNVFATTQALATQYSLAIATASISLTASTGLELRASNEASHTTDGTDDYIITRDDGTTTYTKLEVTYTPFYSLTVSTIYQFDQITSLTSGLYLSYQDTTNATGPIKYAFTGSRTFNKIPASDVIRFKVQWLNDTATNGGVQVNASASVDVTMSADKTVVLYISVFKSTTVAFQYSDSSTSFPSASVTSVLFTDPGNSTQYTKTSFTNIGLVRNGSYTVDQINVFGGDYKSTTSFSVTADSSTKTLVAKVHKPTLNFRRNDGTALTPTSFTVTAPNSTSLVLTSFTTLVMVEGAYTPTALTYWGVDLKKNGTAFTPSSMSGQFTFNALLYASTTLAFQYSDASTSFPAASVTSVVYTNPNGTQKTVTAFTDIGLVTTGTVTVDQINIFGGDIKSTTSFSVTTDSSTKTLVAKVHKPTLNTRRNDGTAITPTSIVLVAPGNLTSLTISSSYATLIMVEGAYTPSSINFYGSDVKLNATTFTPSSMSGQFTFNTIIYTRTPTFKDSAGTALYTQPSSYKVTSVNTTLSPSLTPGSSAIIVGGTSTVSAITWQGTDVTPSSATFDSASGSPDFNLKIYALNVQNTLYPSTTLSTAHSITFPNSTSVEKTPSSGWINMSQVQSGTITLTATITVSSTERYQSYNTSSFTLSANTNRVHHWLHEYSASLTPKGAGGFTPNTAPTTLSFTLLNGTSKSLSPGSATWLLAGAGTVSSVTWQSIEVVASSTSVTIASGTDYTFNTLITRDTDSIFNFAIGGATATSFSSLSNNKLTLTATAATGSHTLKLEIISTAYQVQPSKVSVDATDYSSSASGWVFSTTLFTLPITFSSSPTIIIDFTQTSPGSTPPSSAAPSSGSGRTRITTTTTTTNASAPIIPVMGDVTIAEPVPIVNPISLLIPEPFATLILLGMVGTFVFMSAIAYQTQKVKEKSVRPTPRDSHMARVYSSAIPIKAPAMLFFSTILGILGLLLISGQPTFQNIIANIFIVPQVTATGEIIIPEVYPIAFIIGGVMVTFAVALFLSGITPYRMLNNRLVKNRR